MFAGGEEPSLLRDDGHTRGMTVAPGGRMECADAGCDAPLPVVSQEIVDTERGSESAYGCLTVTSRKEPLSHVWDPREA